MKQNINTTKQKSAKCLFVIKIQQTTNGNDWKTIHNYSFIATKAESDDIIATYKPMLPLSNDKEKYRMILYRAKLSYVATSIYERI